MNAPLSPAHLPTRRQSFSVILAIELWERFGFYGMQAVLLLYLVQHLGFSDQHATLLIGAFSALNYIFPVPGGLAGDRLLGARRSMLTGAVLLTAGYVTLGLADQHLSLLATALALIATGNGLFKPNAGNIVRKIYEGDDAELDAAFTIYYMSVNVGSMVSMLLTPVLQDKFGSETAFFVCAGGLVLGLGYYLSCSRWLKPRDGEVDRVPLNLKTVGLVGGGIVLCLLASQVVLGNEDIARDSIWVAAVLIVLILGWLYRHVAVEERLGLKIAYLLCAETMVYALFYQQQLTSLTLFALRGVDGDFRIGSHVLFHLSAGQFQAMDPMWIMLFSPVLAMLYNRLARSGNNLSLAIKIVIGFAMGAASFLIWWLSAASTSGLISGWVMLIGYGFASLGELLTMALGLAIIARYVPARFSGFMMGSLYLLWALAFYLGSVMSSMSVGVSEGVTQAAAFVPLLRELSLIFVVALAAAVALLPLVNRWDRQFSAK